MGKNRSQFHGRCRFGITLIPIHFFSSILQVRKQTGPNSTPNSWSTPPTSTGAISTIGIFATFSVLNSITVLLQVDDRLCKIFKKIFKEKVQPNFAYCTLKQTRH